MSFRCDFCHQPSPKNTPLHLVPTKTRESFCGSQIVSEAKMCQPCWEKGTVVEERR